MSGIIGLIFSVVSAGLLLSGNEMAAGTTAVIGLILYTVLVWIEKKNIQ